MKKAASDKLAAFLIMTIADHPAALRRWAALGAGLRRAPPTWEASNRLIAAARESVREDAKRLDLLLKESAALFHPLDDPFSVELGLHRWLEADREEAYSDWLAWTAAQASAVEVFRLFGLNPPPNTKSIPTIDRERLVSDGHEGHAGRLDIVIELDKTALLVVEIKKGDAEHADVVKHGGYMRWIDQQPHKHKNAVLIVSAADHDEYSGFRSVEWATVCVSARCIALRLRRDECGTAAALVLGFVAAVEQNLMGFSVEHIQMIRNGKAGLFNPAVVDHLQRFINESDSNDGQSTRTSQ